MIALAIVLASLIFGTILYMEWDNRKHWEDGRKLSKRELATRTFVYNNPFLESMMAEAGLL